MVGRRERRLKQLPDELNETGGEEKFKMETLDRPRWRTRFENG